MKGKRLAAGCFIALASSSPGAAAQASATCATAVTVSSLKNCIDTLFARRTRDSAIAAKNRVTIDSLVAENRQMQAAIQGHLPETAS